MTTLTCPLCGSAVREPNAKPLQRLHCKRCHTPFYLDRAGDAVVGQPPDVELEVEELKQKVREKVKQVPIKKVVGGLVFLLVAWVVVSYFLRPVDRLKPAAERAAQAFAENDVDTLKSFAAPRTADDLVRWYGEFQPQLAKMRQRWSGKPETIDVGVAGENEALRRGITTISIHPGMGNARDVSLANPGEVTASADGSFDVSIDWALSPGGHWEIDGHSTLAKIHPPTSGSSNQVNLTGTTPGR